VVGGGGKMFLFLLYCKKPALGLCVIWYCIVSTVGARVSFLFVNFVIVAKLIGGQVFLFLFFGFCQFCDVAKLMIFRQQDLAKFGYRLDMKVKGFN